MIEVDCTPEICSDFLISIKTRIALCVFFSGKSDGNWMGKGDNRHHHHVDAWIAPQFKDPI